MTPRRNDLRTVIGLLAFAIFMAGLGVAGMRGTTPRRPVAKPTVSPTASPTRKPVPTKKATPRPQPVRTYSAPPDGIPVTGRVVAANGRPVTGADVSLTAHEGFFEGFGRALAAIASLGLACAADENICTVPYGVARSDSAGRYTVYLKGVVDDYDLVVGSGKSPQFSVRIDFAGKALRLPDIVAWTPAPRLVLDGTRAVVRYPAPPARLGTWDGTSANVKVGENTLYLGRLQSGDSFDARLIEDSAAILDVSYTIRTKLGKASYSGKSPEVRGRLRALSRGRLCYEYGNGGKRVTNAPCPLTDGNLFKEWTPKIPDVQCSQGDCDRRVTVDLGSVRRLRYVAVRVCDDFFDSVEVSADGTRWTTVIEQHSGEGGDVDDVCARAIDVSARYVRVSGPDGGFYSRRSEISVF